MSKDAFMKYALDPERVKKKKENQLKGQKAADKLLMENALRTIRKNEKWKKRYCF